MKRYSWIAALLLTLALGVSLVGCGGEVPPAPWKMTENWDGEFGTFLAADGGATVTKEGKTIKVTGGSNSWDGLALKQALFTSVGKAPYKITVTGTIEAAGGLKLGGASDPYTPVPGADEPSIAAGAEFTLSGSVDKKIAAQGVRIAASTHPGPTQAFVITEIEIVEE